jgi:hypothetical protein
MDFLKHIYVSVTNEGAYNAIHDWKSFFYEFCLVDCDFWKETSINHNNTRSNKSGVYMINNIYIGKSNNIYNRIKQHIGSAINTRHYNLMLQDSICDCLFYGKNIDLKILSNDTKDESRLIREYQKQLVNQHANIYEK